MKNFVFAMLLSFILFPLKSVAHGFEQLEVRDNHVVFRVCADAKAKVLLRLYNDGECEKPFKTVKMKYAGDNVFTAKVKGKARRKVLYVRHWSRRDSRCVCQGSGRER